MPSVDISSIGAGGGSIARVDAGGLLKVGPQSAGSDPGPACYGRGGVRPTVTDAYVTLGVLHPDRFLGGELPARRASRRRPRSTRLGRDLQMDRYQAAWAVLEVATANMYAQLTPLLAKRGVDPRRVRLPAVRRRRPHPRLPARARGGHLARGRPAAAGRALRARLPGGRSARRLRQHAQRRVDARGARRRRGRLPGAGERGRASGWSGEGLPVARRDARAVRRDALQGAVVRDQRAAAGRPDRATSRPVLPPSIAVYEQRLRLRGSDGARSSWWTCGCRWWGAVPRPPRPAGGGDAGPRIHAPAPGASTSTAGSWSGRVPARRAAARGRLHRARGRRAVRHDALVPPATACAWTAGET